MDEDFEGFLEDFGPAIEKRAVPTSRLEYYHGKLPNKLLAYWQAYGWCGYADGLFWTVDPEEYDSVVEAWIGETEFMEQDAYHIIARTAFGGLYFWGERSGFSLKVFAPGSYSVPRKSRFTGDKMDFGAQVFFGGLDPNDNDFEQLFAPTLKKLGRLRYDEMYGFVPALALGGPATLDHLEKVKAVEHLVLLAQLSELRVMSGPEI